VQKTLKNSVLEGHTVENSKNSNNPVESRAKRLEKTGGERGIRTPMFCPRIKGNLTLTPE
jgi:hypothetical protein